MSSAGRPDHLDADGAIRGAWWDYASIVAAQALTMGLAVGGVSLASRLLGPSGYGTVALFVSAVQLLYAVAVSWTMTATIRFGRAILISDGAAGRFFWSWLPLMSGSLLVALVTALAASDWIGTYVGLPAIDAGLFVLLLVATALARAVEYLLQTTGRMRMYAAALPAGKVAYVMALAWLALQGAGATAERVVLVMAAALLVEVVVGGVFLDARLLRPVTVDGDLMRGMVAYSLPLVLAFVAGYLFDWIDVYMLRLFRTTAEIGIYHAAYQSMMVVSAVLVGISTLGFPLLTTWRAAGAGDRAERYLTRLVPQLAVCWALVVTGLGVAGGFLFPLLFGAAFEEGTRYLAMLLVGAAFQVVTYCYTSVFSAYDALGRTTAILFVMVFVNGVADLALIPVVGSLGAAIGTATSYALGAVLYLILGNRRLGVRGATALAPPCIAGIPLVAFAVGGGAMVHLALALLAAGVIVGWAKRRRVFGTADLSMFDQVALPRALRIGITKAYEVLS